MQTFNEWIETNVKELPSIFRRTYYSLPTKEQIEEFQDYPNLSSDDIVEGFSYTMIGRGIKSPTNLKKIVDSINMLIDRYPENKTYREALEKVKRAN